MDEYYDTQESVDPMRKEQIRALMLEKLDAYLSSHTLEAKLPESIVGSNIVPRSLLESVSNSISIPLSDAPVENGMGFFLFKNVLLSIDYCRLNYIFFFFIT